MTDDKIKTTKMANAEEVVAIINACFIKNMEPYSMKIRRNKADTNDGIIIGKHESDFGFIKIHDVPNNYDGLRKAVGEYRDMYNEAWGNVCSLREQSRNLSDKLAEERIKSDDLNKKVLFLVDKLQERDQR